MLAELFLLHRNLRLQGVGVARVHPDMDTPGVTGLLNLRVKLDKAGRVRQLSLLSPEIEPGLWTLTRGNHSYFPAVRTDKTPLLRLNHDDAAWPSTERPPTAELVANLCDRALSAAAQFDLRAISQNQAARIAAWPVAAGDGPHRHLHDFAEGFEALADDPDHTTAELLSGIKHAGTNAADPALLATLTAVIIGKLKKGKSRGATQTQVEYGAQLLFDFWSDDEPSFSLYSFAVREVVLDALLTEKGEQGARKSARSSAEQGTCALSGQNSDLLRSRFPRWSAKPVISKSLHPFNKFSEAPCNFRYQRADSEAFDIGKITANDVVGAMKTVTEGPMLGKTWRPLKNGFTSSKGMEQSDVLIVYPSCSVTDLQDEPMPRTVDVVGEPDTASEVESAALRKSFEDAAQPVCNAFNKAIAREAAAQRVAPDLQILLIRQISSGQIQIAYSAQPTLVSFVAAVDAWSQSGSNLPDALRVPLRRDKTPSGFALVKPRLIFPERISRVLARQWTHAGSDSTAVPAPPVGMVLDLFLRRPGALPTLAAELLSTTLSRTEPLLRGVGGVLHRDQLHPAHADFLSQWKHFLKGAVKGNGKPDPGYAAANTLSLIGSLLYAMDSKASDYTRRSAFLVGKLLAMMDELHKHYCTVVRDGAMPPTLIGNSLLGRASDSPAQALAELSDRSRPYIGWAKTVATPDRSAQETMRIAVHSARKLLRVAQPLCELLGTDGSLDRELGDLDKAHLLLGYLSPVLTSTDKIDYAVVDEVAPDTTDTIPIEVPAT